MATELSPIYVNEEPDDPNAVSLDTSTPQDDSVSLPIPGASQQPLPRDIATQRAAKTEQGLGKLLNKTKDDIYEQFLQGEETALRKEAATKVDFQRAAQRQQQLTDIASKQTTPVTPEQVMQVMDPFNSANKPADPATVIERAYSTDYVSSLNTAKGFMLDAGKEMPKQVQDTLDEGSELLTKNQYILHRMQDTEANLVQKQSWPGYLADQAKTMFQPYNEYNQRFEGVSALGLGSDLDVQHSNLYQMPMDQFKATFDARMTYLEAKNPSLAVAYAKSMLGQSTWDSAVNNTFTAIAIPDYLAIGKVGAKIAQKISTFNQVRRATADIVDSAGRNPNADRVTMAEGAGDINEAAVRSVARSIDDALAGKGDPIQMAKKALLSTWYEDAQKFTNNPGTYLSRELVTRIQDGFARDGEELINRIATMNRVERTPVAVTSEAVIRDYINKIKREYKGPQNTLLDVEGPIREPVSGTYWYKSKIGNYDATQFPDRETAEGFAHQLGISEPIIKGQEAGKVYIPTAAAKNIESIKQTAGGKPRFYVNNDIEVVPSSQPQPGHVPYNLATSKFETELTEESARIEQQGLGFHVEVWTPMRENDNLVRDLMIKTHSGEFIKDAISTNSASGANSIKNSLLGWVRNSDDTLSVNESAQRKAVTYTQANIHKWAQGLAKDLEDIASGRVREDPVTGEPLSALTIYPKSWFGKLSSRKVAQQFERTLDYARKAVDSEGNAGGFFKNPGELQEFYNRNFQRDPSYLDTKAYFNYVKLIEGDRVMGEVAEFRNRARIGTEQHAITVTDNQTGEKIQSRFFDGIRHPEFRGREGDNVLIMGFAKGEETLHELGTLNSKTVKDMTAKVRSGQGKFIELYDKDHQPLSDFSEVANNKIVHFVYTENSEAKPIEFNHVKRREGGHFEWDYDHYLKQADMRPQYPTGINDKRKGVKNLYVGDTTVMPIKNRKLGANVAQIWNEAHELIKQGRWDDVRPLAAKLGINYDEFKGWYHPGRDETGRVARPRLSANEPIVVVQKNKKISDMGADLHNRYLIKNRDGKYIDTFKDDTKSGPANNFKVAYNQERNSTFDMRTVNDIGSQGNPVYAHQPADMIDPLTTMNRALNRAINSTFMDDYKIYAVEHWLREAEPFLDAKGGLNEIRSAPFQWFHDPKWAAGVDKNTISNFLSNRYKTMQLIGVPDRFNAWVHSLTTHLADSFYTKYGPEGSRTIAQKAVSIVPIWALHHVTDPISFMRSVTFNFKLGLGAIPQFLVQAQTHSLIWALEPRHGTIGTYHMLLHGWSGFTTNPRILQALDNYATKLNMFGSKARPGEFLEARQELAKSGFEHVAGEYANLNNQLKTAFIMNDFQKGLKIGQFPFRMGEQSTRITAWYTAFREFREANPTTPITNIERSKILAKADLLTVNMSRASTSALNSGIFSLSTQFLTYQIKLAELFWGKRMGETLTERNLARARIVTLFSALYGVPNAIGVTGAPFTDNLREHFMDDLGYIPGEKWTSTLINEGLPAWQTAMITGQLPNVGDRFGSQGFQNVKQALRGDIPMWQALGGAATSTFSNVLSSGLDPFYQGVMSWMRDDRSDERFTLRSADLIEPLKEISSFSSAYKWLAAINTGKWLNKSEQPVTDVTPLQATIYGLTGMSPQEQDDMFINNQMIKGEEELKKKAQKEFIKDWRRGREAKENGDTEQGDAYFRNAFARAKVAGFDASELNTAIALGNRTGNAIDDSNYATWSKGDANKREGRMQQYKRKLHLKD